MEEKFYFKFNIKLLKLLVLSFVVFIVLFKNNCVYAGNVHYIHTNWYNDAISLLPKEEVVGIKIVCGETKPDNYIKKIDMDGKGLEVFVLDNNEVVIYYPEGDILRAGIFAKGLFSFYRYEEIKDYEIDENDYVNKNVLPNDSDIDRKTEYKSKLEYIDNLDLLDTSEVQNMSGMFCGLSSITELDLSNFSTRNVTDMSYMFYGCERLKNIDIGSFNGEKLVDMALMFAGCIDLEKIEWN